MDLDLASLMQQALWLSVLLSLPVVVTAGVVSLLMAFFQALTQVQDVTLAHLPRFVAVVVALGVSGAWMGSELVRFARDVMGGLG